MATVGPSRNKMLQVAWAGHKAAQKAEGKKAKPAEPEAVKMARHATKVLAPKAKAAKKATPKKKARAK